MTSKAFGLAQLGNVFDDGALSNRNLIINGAMQVAQRGTSSSSGGYSTVDRYYHNLSGATSTMTREEATFGQEVDGQFKYWVKLNTTVGNNYCGIQQRVEDVRSLREGRATLSFWVKGTNPASGQYLVQMQRLPAGASGSTLDIPLDDTYTVSSTWTRKVFTFDVPALGTSVTETANSMLYITLGAQEGTDTSTDAWELNITGVQLELGDTSTPFEHRSYGDELARCQRYYEVDNPATPNTFGGNIRAQAYHPANGSGNPLNRDGPFQPYKVDKRASATVTTYAYNGTTGAASGITGGGTDSNVQVRSGTTGFQLSSTTYRALYVWFAWAADAEL
jgi:hypothetical protein